MDLIIIAIANILGIIMGLYFKKSIAFFVILILIIYIIKMKNKYIKSICRNRYIIIFILFYLFSFCQINFLEKSYNEKYINIKGQIYVEGTIVSNVIDKEYKSVCTIKIEKINGSNYYKDTKLLLNIKKGDVKYSYGDKILLLAEFEQASSQRNEGGFNYKEYLKTKGIYGIITTTGNKINIEKHSNVNFIDKFANDVANLIQSKIYKLFDGDNADVLEALLVGNKDNLSEDIKDTFKNSNLSHMLAISGAHVSYIIMGIGYIFSKIKINSNLKKIITVILLLFFIILTGSTPSVTRACIMAIYMIFANLLHKRVNVLSSISISSILILISNPYSILDIGMQLSYAGTIGIILIYPIIKKLVNKKEISIGKQKVINKLKDIIFVSLSANIIIIPIMMYNFNTISVTFLISNILASPFLGILILLGFLTVIISFIFIPLAEILAVLLNFFIGLFLSIANFSAKLPLSQIYVVTPKIYEIFIYYLILIIIIIYNKLKYKTRKTNNEKKIFKIFSKINKKSITISIFIVILFNFTYNQIPKELQIYFVDVGQGDCTLINTSQNKHILIDGGGSENFDVGEKTLLPYVLNRGITTIDYLIISHFDSDHCRRTFYCFRTTKCKTSNNRETIRR